MPLESVPISASRIGFVDFVDVDAGIAVVRIAVGDENVDIHESHAVGGGGCGAVALHGRLFASLHGGLNVRSVDGDTVGGVRHVAELLAPTPLRVDWTLIGNIDTSCM